MRDRWFRFDVVVVPTCVMNYHSRASPQHIRTVRRDIDIKCHNFVSVAQLLFSYRSKNMFLAKCLNTAIPVLVS